MPLVPAHHRSRPAEQASAPAGAAPRATRPPLDRHEPIRTPGGVLRGEGSPAQTPAEEAVATAYRVFDRYVEEGRRYAAGQSAWNTTPVGVPPWVGALAGSTDLLALLLRLVNDIARLLQTLGGPAPTNAVSQVFTPPQAPSSPGGGDTSPIGATLPGSGPSPFDPGRWVEVTTPITDLGGRAAPGGALGARDARPEERPPDFPLPVGGAEGGTVINESRNVRYGLKLPPMGSARTARDELPGGAAAVTEPVKSQPIKPPPIGTGPILSTATTDLPGSRLPLSIPGTR